MLLPLLSHPEDVLSLRSACLPPEGNVGLPLVEMTDAYSRETLALKREVESYVAADPYDPERPKIVAVRFGFSFAQAALLAKYVFTGFVSLSCALALSVTAAFAHVQALCSCRQILSVHAKLPY